MASIVVESRDSLNFSVPSSVVDQYLHKASFVQIKVLLFLLRSTGKNMEKQDIAAALQTTEEEIDESLAYWLKNAVLYKRGERVCVYSGQVSAGDSIPVLPPEAISQKMKNSAKTGQYINTASEIIGRLLTNNELSVLLSFEDFLGLPNEVSLMAIEYTVSSGKKGFRDIERTAVKWADNEINTIEKADRFLKNEFEKRSTESRFKRIIGAGDRNLTETEKKKIEQWVSEYGYGDDVITLAFEKTVDSTGKYSISYMAKIVSSWYEKGFKAVNDMKNDKVSTKRSKDSGRNKDTSYDVNKGFMASWKIVHGEE